VARTFKISIPEIAPSASTEIVEVVSEQLVIDPSDGSNRTWRVIRNESTIANYLSPGQYGATYEAYLIHNANKVYPNAVSLLGGVETVTISGGASDLTYRFNYATGVLLFDQEQDPTRIFYLHAYRPAFFNRSAAAGGETVIEQTIINNYSTTVVEGGGDTTPHNFFSDTHLDTDADADEVLGDVPVWVSGSSFAEGTYPGNSGTYSVTNLGFRPKLVIVKGDSGGGFIGMMRSDTMSEARNLTNATSGQGISSIDDDGFTVIHDASADGKTNSSGTNFYWWAIGGNNVYTNTYTGDTIDNHAVTGLGFEPIILIIADQTDSSGVVYRTADMGTENYDFGANNGEVDQIKSLDTDGFTLGTSTFVNAAREYHFIAVKAGDNVATGWYPGNGVDGRDLPDATGSPTSVLSFNPDFVQIKANAGQEAWFKITSLTGDAALPYAAAPQNSNRIQSLTPADGQFEVGTNSDTNSGVIAEYFWFAFSASTGGDGRWEARPPDDHGTHGGSAAPTNHNHTAADGGTLTNSEVDSYVQWTETAHPTNTPAANNLWLYGADDGGLTKLFYKLQDGTTIGPLGAGGASHSAITFNAAIEANLLSLTGQEIGLDTQAQFNVFAGPSAVATGTPAFRNLVDGDIPATHAGSAHHSAVSLNAVTNANLLSLTNQEINLDTQVANNVFAGPTTGGNATPAFRNLVDADIPAAIMRDAEHAADPHTMTIDGVDVSAHAALTTHANSYYGIDVLIDGGGSAITTGIKGDVEVPVTGVVEEWRMLADQNASGNFVIDVWQDTYANYPATVADTIAGAEKPTITSGQLKGSDDTLTASWLNGGTITAENILRFNVDSAGGCQKVTLALKVRRV